MKDMDHVLGPTETVSNNIIARSIIKYNIILIFEYGIVLRCCLLFPCTLCH